MQDGAANPREIKRCINLYTLQTKVNDGSLDKRAMLALQTVACREDWYDVYSAMLH